jgi:hypothetical protein
MCGLRTCYPNQPRGQSAEAPLRPQPTRVASTLVQETQLQTSQGTSETQSTSQARGTGLLRSVTLEQVV